MNLYLIKRPDKTGWGLYDSAVVLAESPECARNIHPAGLGHAYSFETDQGRWNDTWVPPEQVIVTLLAVDMVTPDAVRIASENHGVIIADMLEG